MLTKNFPDLIRLCFILTALSCRIGASTIEVQGTSYAYKPVSVVSTSRGFVLASNSMDKADSSWNISLIDINSDFNITVERTLTGNKSNTVQKIIGLDDGLILLGNTSSSEGVFKTTESVLQDIVVARLDKQMGIRWSINLGGHGLNHAQDISVSRETGTVTVLGWIDEPGDEIPDHFGGWDIVVAQYDLHDGKLRWTRTLGGREDDIAGVLLSVGDSTYVCYNTWSNRKKWDIELVRLDKRGRVRLRKTLGGKGTDLIARLIHCPDGLIALGSTESEDFVPEARGGTDIFVMGLTERGRTRWGVRLGGSRADMAADIVETDGRLTILGWSESNDIDVHDHLGGKDLVVFSLGIDDREVHSYMYGTLDDDWPLQIISMKDHLYIFGGTKVSERVQQPFWINLNF